MFVSSNPRLQFLDPRQYVPARGPKRFFLLRIKLIETVHEKVVITERYPIWIMATGLKNLSSEQSVCFLIQLECYIDVCFTFCSLQQISGVMVINQRRVVARNTFSESV